MAKNVDDRVLYHIKDSDASNSVTIPANVIESITCFAALGIDGVVSVGGIKKDDIPKVGDGGVSGIKVVADEKSADIYIAIELEYGFNIPDVANEIQEKVKTSIESMTDFKVTSVNIKITDLIFKK